MIQVKLHCTNYVTLKGDCLKDGTMQDSYIALHSTGWAVGIHTADFYDVREGLHRNSVFETVREMLADFHCEEEIDVDEISRYMNLLTTDACRPVPAEWESGR